MNRKAVEGLPLKYIIIIIAAILVIEIILEMTGIIEVGIISSLYQVTNASANMSSGLPG